MADTASMIFMPTADRSQQPTRKPRALIVDDSRAIREVALLSLGVAAGWDVTAVASGTEALAVAHSHRPDVILLDVLMSENDGLRTLARLRHDPDTREIPVILATAIDGPEQREQLARLGADGIISKPYDLARLADQVTEILAPAVA